MHAAGIDSDRVLLLGSGIAVGYGVLSHDLALGGHIARQISAITERGTDVDIVSDPDLSVSVARAALSSLQLSRFDAVILTIGGMEMLQLMPRRMWRRQLEDLLDQITASAPASLQIFLVATPSLPSIAKLLPFYGYLVGRRSALLNEQSRAAVRPRDNATFIEFVPQPGDVVRELSRRTYEEWAARIVPTVSAALNAQAPNQGERVDEDSRVASLYQLGILDSPSDPRYDTIVATARDLLEASGASVTFVDRDRQWVKAAIGMPPDGESHADWLCESTIRHSRIFVLEDVRADARFRELERPRKHAVRFYAGYPLEAPDGHRVGALSIVNTKPRHFSDSDAALLRELALSVQALLWGSAPR